MVMQERPGDTRNNVLPTHLLNFQESCTCTSGMKPLWQSPNHDKWATSKSTQVSIRSNCTFCLKCIRTQVLRPSNYLKIEPSPESHPHPDPIINKNIQNRLNKLQSLKGSDMSPHDLALAQESCRGRGTFSPLLTANVCITHHEIFNFMQYLQHSSVLGKLVLHEQKGWDRGRWVGTP